MASNQVRAELVGCRDSDTDIGVDEEPVMQVCEVLGEFWWLFFRLLFDFKLVQRNRKSWASHFAVALIIELAKEFVFGASRDSGEKDVVIL